ncbi:hypothetical protein FRC05_005220 [Tulasnella sp. 425]|nr:hypothetical protein FRC05_005220 [Tulasnella sp. 425]
MYAVARQAVVPTQSVGSEPRYQMLLHNLQMQGKVYYRESAVADGPRHCETWTASVFLLNGPNGDVVNTIIARGTTRQAAREAAAGQALTALGYFNLPSGTAEAGTLQDNFMTATYGTELGILAFDLPRLHAKLNREARALRVLTAGNVEDSAERQPLNAVPAGGLLLLYASPKQESPVPALLASPSIIPVAPREAKTTRDDEEDYVMSSPNEPHLGQRIVDLLHSHVLEPIGTGLRFLHLMFYFFPVIASWPMVLIGSPVPEFDGERWGAIWWYGLLTKQMQRAGPTFIKLAQWAASRVDIFPQQLCERLGTLHSTTKPHSFAHTKRVVEHAFGMSFDEVFEEFEEQPIGSGAIAQVYRATLRKDVLPPSYLLPKRPRPRHLKPTIAADGVVPPPPPPAIPSGSVAVKVLHPRVDKMINRDLKIMKFFADWIATVPGLQWISLPEEVEVFGEMMREQCDLRGEARNLTRFEKNFNGRRENAVSFPRPLTEYSTREVLIEEFEDALPLGHFLRNGGGPYDQILATLGLDVFLNMLLLDNFVHADLHPGNIMVKFYKPTTSYILQNIWASLTGSPKPEDPLTNDPSVGEESERIVQKLRSLKHSRTEWLEEIDKLSEEGYQPELVMLDAGLVTVLSDSNRRNFLDLFRAIAEFDGYRAGKLMVERCRAPELVVDEEIFALKIQHLALSVKAKTFSLGQIKIADVLTEVLRNVQTHHVKMEGDFVNTIVSMLLLEGIGRQLDPDMDLFKSALPILRKLGRQMSVNDVNMANARSFGAMLKIWVWVEARELAHGAFQDADDFIRYDWSAPSFPDE